jgi:hypothetical protein
MLAKKTGQSKQSTNVLKIAKSSHPVQNKGTERRKAFFLLQSIKELSPSVHTVHIGKSI